MISQASRPAPSMLRRRPAETTILPSMRFSTLGPVRRQGRSAGLLAFARAFGRAIDEPAVLHGAALTGGLGLAAAIRGVTVRRLGLMRDMLMIARLEVLELLARAFAVLCHGASGIAVQDQPAS